MEAGKYAVSSAGSAGNGGRQTGKDQCLYCGLGGHGLHQSPTTERMAYAVDYCGVKSGRDVDKFQKLKLQTEPASEVGVPMIKDAPVCIECRVTEVKHLGSHDLFLAKVLAVHAEEDYLDQKGRLRLQEAGMLVYSHGEYYGLGKKLGTFGYSVRRRKERK